MNWRETRRIQFIPRLLLSYMEPPDSWSSFCYWVSQKHLSNYFSNKYFNTRPVTSWGLDRCRFSKIVAIWVTHSLPSIMVLGLSVWTSFGLFTHDNRNSLPTSVGRHGGFPFLNPIIDDTGVKRRWKTRVRPLRVTVFFLLVFCISF